MNIQFTGTSFFQARYVEGEKIFSAMRKYGGYTHTKVAGNDDLPYIVITDPERNPKADQIDVAIREVAEEAAEKHGVPLKQIYYYSPRPDLSERWEKTLKDRYTVEGKRSSILK